MRPHQKRIFEEHKLHYFQSSLRDETIGVWQTLRITPEKTLKVVLETHCKQMAKVDLKEHSRYKWGQIVYDHSKENFSDFLKSPENFATLAFADQAAGFVETFLFGMLPIKSQHEVSTAGRTDAGVEEIKTIVQIRLQNQQLIPLTTAPYEYNEMSSNHQQQPHHRYHNE